eukprot:scaffold304434_cov28-Tisochrysis_lutea.AAC.1
MVERGHYLRGVPAEANNPERVLLGPLTQETAGRAKRVVRAVAFHGTFVVRTSARYLVDGRRECPLERQHVIKAADGPNYVLALNRKAAKKERANPNGETLQHAQGRAGNKREELGDALEGP